MFASAELGHCIDAATYEAATGELRADLLDAQMDLLQQAPCAVVVLISGMEGSGKGETANLLNSWFDPRYVVTRAFGPRSEEERERPFMWRFWRALPAKGRVGLFLGSWYTWPLQGRVHGQLRQAALDQHIDEINRFEAMLANEGVLLLKFWLHLSKDAQQRRLKSLAASKATRWRVTDEDIWQRDHYDRFRRVARHTLRLSSTGRVPWLVVEAEDSAYRALTIGRAVLDAMRRRLDGSAASSSPISLPPLPPPALDQKTVLDALDLTQSLGKKAYAKELARWQGRLAELSRHPKFAHHSLVVVFEGADAAGKGGAIRRVVGALDARQVDIVPVAAPSEEERAQPYMWRFWRHVPRLGRVVLFDRSWYGRVLVERVEKFCSESDWLRAYAEINDFEDQLTRHGAVVVKFWLQISNEEQLQRFKAREQTRFKRFKITEEDWRNREKWDDYRAAVCDMVDRTSTGAAPWVLVEAEDKRFSRIKVLKTLCKRLEAALED